MRIVHLESGRHLYGGALQVRYLTQGLTAAGHDSILVCPRGSAIARAGAEARIAALPMGGELDAGLALRLWHLLLRVKPDLLHVHSRRGADLWGGIAARLAGVPAVITRRVDNPEARWLARSKYRLYRRVIAISPAIAELLQAAGVPPARIALVPSAVDSARFHPAAADGRLRREFGLAADMPLVGMIAQFIPRKGHLELLEAVERIRDRIPRTRFVFFGQGPLRARIEQACRQRTLTERVIFADFREDLERLLPELAVVVHPAAMEGLGVSLLQAAAAGVPVVAYAVGGLPLAVADGVTGRLVARGDAAGLAQALLELLQNPAGARRLGEAGRQRVLADFSIEAMVRRYIAIYRQAGAVSAVAR